MDQVDSQMSESDLKLQQLSSKKIMLKFQSLKHEKSFKPHCQPDLFDSSIACTANDTRDHRRYTSHFFGRNKSHTATIPHSYFTMLCRKHYQDKYYRWQDEPGLYAALQCDSILLLLGKMAQKVFSDDYGNEWPWWCGFELRLPILVDADLDETDSSSISMLPSSISRLPPSMSMPPWLLEMCSKANEDSDELLEAPDESSGTPHRLHCNLLQLVQIVKALRKWCTDTNLKLPLIQALPVTIGMINKEALKTAEKNCKEVRTQSDALRNDWHRLEDSCRADCSSAGSVQRARQAFEISLQEVESAKQNVVFASTDLKTSATTLPATRTRNPRSDNVAERSSSEDTLPDRRRRSKRKKSREPEDGNGKRIRSG